MTEFSAAEQRIAPFYDPNSVNFLVVSPEDARDATKMFANMCATQISENSYDLNITEWVPGFAEVMLEKQAYRSDGSDVKAAITAKETLPPDYPRPPYFNEQDNTRGEVVIRSRTGGNLDGMQANFVAYSIDDAAKQVRKRTFRPLDNIRLLEHHAQVVNETQGSQAAADMIAAHTENELANRELEQQLGIDDSVLVGTEEVTQLQILLDSLPVAR